MSAHGVDHRLAFCLGRVEAQLDIQRELRGSFVVSVGYLVLSILLEQLLLPDT